MCPCTFIQQLNKQVIKCCCLWLVFTQKQAFASQPKRDGMEKPKRLSKGFSSLKIEKIQMHTHTYTRSLSFLPQQQLIVHKWSSNGQVVIRHNKGSTSENLPACRTLLCFHTLSVCLMLLYTCSRRLRCTYRPIHDSQEAPQRAQLRDAWMELLQKRGYIEKIFLHIQHIATNVAFYKKWHNH